MGTCLQNAQDDTKPAAYRLMMQHFAEAGRQILETVECFGSDSGIVSRKGQTAVNDTEPLRNQAAAYCPTCKRHTEQTRGAKRGERHCWSCGENFTLRESRAAQEVEYSQQCEGCESSSETLRVTDDDVSLCNPCFGSTPAAATAAPQESDTRPSCWHCGVVLAYAPKLRCEDCPDECDVEGCDELGCAPTKA